MNGRICLLPGTWKEPAQGVLAGDLPRWSGPTRQLAMVLLSSLLCLASARADLGTEHEPRLLTFSGESSVAWVLVPVTARDDSGHRQGLQPHDFELWVDDRQVPIESFESGPEAPLSLLILQDLSGSMANGGKLQTSNSALDCLLHKGRAQDELALATFGSGRVRLDVPFTSNRATIEQAAHEWEAYGTTALNDAVAALPQLYRGGRHMRRAALLVTDGLDNASTFSPDSASRLLRLAELPVYVLELNRAAAEPAKKRHATTVQDRAVDVGENGAHPAVRLAQGSGGHHFVIHDDLSLQQACAELIEELRFQYVLGFRTGSTGPSTWRRLRVEVPADPALRIAHRPGYEGDPPR